MNIKSHKSRIWIFGFFLICSNSWAYPVLGECFRDVGEARLGFFPHDPDQIDPDISIKNYGQWLWIVDKTPRVNYDRLLLERVANNFCYRASVSGNSVDLKKYRDVWVLDVNEPPVGISPGQKIRYRMRIGDAMFRRTGCYQYLAVGRPKSTTCMN